MNSIHLSRRSVPGLFITVSSCKSNILEEA